MKNARLTAEVLQRAFNVCGSICVVLLLLCAAETLFSGSLIATWNPNTEADLAGYKVCYGTESGKYSVEKDVGNTTVYVADNLTDGQNYFFVVKAYDQTGNVSNPSVEVNGRPGKPTLVAINQGNAVRLVWTPIAGTQNYQIFKGGTPYFTPAVPIATVNATVFKYDDAQHVAANEKESYYSVRAIANGQLVFSFDTVGAYDVPLHSGLNLVSLPLIPADSTINAVFGGQLTGGESSSTADQLRIWNGEEYEINWCYKGTVVESNGKWINSKTGLESGRKLDPSQSFWVKIQEGHPAAHVTVTGQVPTDSNRVIPLKKGYNFVSSCYPAVVSLNESELYQDKVVKGGVGSGKADIVRAWADTTYFSTWVVDGTGTNLDGIWMDESGKNKSTIEFRPGEGYVIWIKGDNPEKIWTYPNPAIKQ
jgi:hypothetical protein